MAATGQPVAQARPTLRPVSISDLVEAIGAGIRDFRKAPVYGLFFAGLYVTAGWLLVALLWHFGMPYFAYPLAMGFALVAPFAATGFYAVSAALERGDRLSWGTVLAAVRRAAGGEVRWMAIITGFALIIWMDIAAFVLFAFTTFHAITPDTMHELLTTPTGLFFAFLGNAIGAVIALGVFSISVVSFPLLYDRQVDFVTAMVTSVNVVLQSPKAMVLWCALIAAAMALSLVTAFLGLFLAMPLVGHATWHLYRRAVEPAA